MLKPIYSKVILLLAFTLSLSACNREDDPPVNYTLWIKDLPLNEGECDYAQAGFNREAYVDQALRDALKSLGEELFKVNLIRSEKFPTVAIDGNTTEWGYHLVYRCGEANLVKLSSPAYYWAKDVENAKNLALAPYEASRRAIINWDYTSEKDSAGKTHYGYYVNLFYKP